MSKNTKIEWADHTFNPWVGCTKVSPACDHCYAESWAKRSGMVKWGVGEQRQRTSLANWRQPIKWNDEAGRLGVRYRVFCASLADVFDNTVPKEWRADLFELILQTPNLDWLLLTKRIGNAQSMLAEAGDAALVATFGAAISTSFAFSFPNVWIGATICNQEEADRDIPKLLAVPAVRRFLSIEPLLGEIDIVPYLGGRSIKCGCGFRRDEHSLIGATVAREKCMLCNGMTSSGPTLDWVIVGGESGHGARPMSPDWVRSLRDQCRATKTPFMFKQWGEWLPMLGQEEGVAVSKKISTPDGWIMGWTGKRDAGRSLDGRIWDEVPS
jgi:protein gp37